MSSKSSQRSQYLVALAGFFLFEILYIFIDEVSEFTFTSIKQISASIGAMAQSAAVNWATPTGPQVLNKLILTDEQIPWVGSTLTITAGSMCILTGFLASFIGRKTAMLLLVIPFTFGWTLIIFARNFTMVIMGRALLGIATGGVCVIVPIYIAEIAETRIRGVLCYLFQLSSSVGTLLVGASITTSRLSVVCAAIPLVFGILILFCPESPTYLMQNNRPGDASWALLRLRGRRYNPSIELNAIQSTLKQHQPTQQREEQQKQKQKQPRLQRIWSRDQPTQQREEQQKQKQKQPRLQRIWSRVLFWHREKKLQPAQYKEAFQSLFRQSSVKALFISYGLFICQQMCGINILKFYTEDIFTAVDETKINSASFTAFIGVVATFIAGFIVDRIGRRALLLASQIIITICSLSLGFYFRIKESNADSVDHLNWIPLIILGVFTVAFSIGLGPIPWVILGEIFATDVKCLAGSISTSASLTLAFITTKTHDSLHEVFGAGGVFWLYTTFSLLGTVFVYFVVPETKGKSLNNIQQIINDVQPADSDGLLENSDNIAMKELRDGRKGKFFTL